MADTTFSRRPHCDGCALPSRTCVCALVARVHNEVDVLVLQHPDEAREAKGSARLMRLSLVRCRVVVGEVFDLQALFELLDGDVSDAALLYPSDTVTCNLDRVSVARPRCLVVLDGTWRKSLRMLYANPLLQTLPRWSLAPSTPGRYAALRKARSTTQLSTLEATCVALADIEDAPARYTPLLASFDRFVEDRALRAGRSAPPK